jgi:hypothetical protein
MPTAAETRRNAARTICRQITVALGVTKELALLRERRVRFAGSTARVCAIRFEIAVTFGVTKELTLLPIWGMALATSTVSTYIHDRFSW